MYCITRHLDMWERYNFCSLYEIIQSGYLNECLVFFQIPLTMMWMNLFSSLTIPSQLATPSNLLTTPSDLTIIISHLNIMQSDHLQFLAGLGGGCTVF